MLKQQVYIKFLGLMTLLCCQWAFAQESPKIVPAAESAELFLEEYTDEFQENFFEALKQKGIQNYNRAIDLLLACKAIDANNKAVNHELAKTYFLDRQYAAAQEHATAALIAAPENYWFLANYIQIVQKQGIPFSAVQEEIPYQNPSLQFNLAKLYFKKGRYTASKKILANLEQGPEVVLLSQKVTDALTPKTTQKPTTSIAVSTQTKTQTTDPAKTALEKLFADLKQLALSNKNGALEEQSTAAIESYPLQPEFYYYNGLAQNKKKKYQQAINVLEEGFSYLFDNDALANKFYQELANAHTGLGNSSKANSYLSKIKPGL